MMYLNRVKDEFVDDLSVYDSFLEVMRDYKQAKIDAGGVVRAVGSLFRGRKHLIEGFNNFLPKHFKIDERSFDVRGDRRDLIAGEKRRFTDMGMERPGDRINERMSERIMHERLSERGIDRLGERAVERINERTGERPSERLIERHMMGERYGDRSMDRQMERPSDRPMERQIDRLTERPVYDRVPIDRNERNIPSERTIDRGDRVIDRGERTMERGERNIDRSDRTMVRGDRTMDRVDRIMERGDRTIERVDRTMERVPIDRPIYERPPQPPIHPNIHSLHPNPPLHPRIPPHPMHPERFYPDRSYPDRSFHEYPERRPFHRPVPPRNEESHKQKKALNFVQKVKRRLTEKPESYRTFIEILQLYQKSPSNPDKILTQLKSILLGHEDLLEEFTDFVPARRPEQEMKGEVKEIPRRIIRPDISNIDRNINSEMNNTGRVTNMDVGNIDGKVMDRKHYAGKYNKEVLDVGREDIGGYAKRNVDNNIGREYERVKRIKETKTNQATREQLVVEDKVVTKEDETNKLFQTLKNKNLLDPFLKLLNMYNQDCISARDFVFLLDGVLKEKRLMDAFKKYIDYEEEDKPPYIIKNMSSYKKIGSYRILPERYQNLITPSYETNSNLVLDGISAEVLNGWCVVCPTLASEDSYFISSKKNVNEEILYRIEDERYECELKMYRVSDLVMNLENLLARIHRGINKGRKNEGSNGDSNKENTVMHKTISLNNTHECGPVKITESLVKIPESLDKISESEAKECDEESLIFTIDDIEMPGGVVLEMLNEIYGEKGTDILEGILTRAQVSLPIVINRLCLVVKQLRKEIRAKNSTWRESTIRNFYRAMDCEGLHFKSTEKKNLSTKKILLESEHVVGDLSVLDDVKSIYYSFVSANNGGGVCDIFEFVVDLLKKEEFVMWNVGCFVALVRYILIMYERLVEMKIYCENKTKESSTDFNNGSNGSDGNENVAKVLKLEPDEEKYRKKHMDDMYNELINISIKSLAGDIDNITFEERLNILTDCQGYKLSSIERIAGKIERQCIAIKSDERVKSVLGVCEKGISKSIAESIFSEEVLYKITKSQGRVYVADNNETEDIDSMYRQYLDRFIKMNVDNDLIKSRVFLNREKRCEIGEVVLCLNLECNINEDSYKIKFVEDTEDFVMRKNKRRVCRGKNM